MENQESRIELVKPGLRPVLIAKHTYKDVFIQNMYLDVLDV